MSISAIVMLVAILIIWGGLGLAMLNRHPDLDALDEAAGRLQGSEL